MILPTGKDFVSFSELQDHEKCNNKHYLKHIKKIKLYKETVHTEFGNSVHSVLECFLKNQDMDYEMAEKEIRDRWKKYNLDGFEVIGKNEEVLEIRNVDWYVRAIKRVLEEIPMFLDLTFPGWTTVSAEERLYEKLPSSFDGLFFKGFIDAVIKTGPEYEPVYYILDWKSSENGWKDWKKRDKMTNYQPIYYREFWSAKNKLKRHNIKCGFVILSYGENVKGPKCELLLIKPTRGKRVGALKVIKDLVSSVTSEEEPKKTTRTIQGWDNCKYCDYANTEYCDGWKKNEK